MKKIQFLLCLLLASGSLFAQYKKASFFTKSGRTYSVGAVAHMMGDGKGTPIGYYFSGGSDNTEKRFFGWYDFVAIPAYKYSYTTTAPNYVTGQDEPLTVSGKSKFHLIYDYNVGFHLLDRSQKEQPVQPYVFLGINAVLWGKANTPDVSSDYDYYYAKKKVTTEGLSFGARGGLGVVYNFTDRIGIKVDGGWNWQYNFSSDVNDGEEQYDMYTTHVFVSGGLRFRFLED